MGIQIIDPKEIALREKKRTVVMNTRKLHAWVHCYPTPGDHDELHCHNEDQVFTCFEGECTMRFPDGRVSGGLKPAKQAVRPRLAVLFAPPFPLTTCASWNPLWTSSPNVASFLTPRSMRRCDCGDA